MRISMYFLALMLFIQAGCVRSGHKCCSIACKNTHDLEEQKLHLKLTAKKNDISLDNKQTLLSGTNALDQFTDIHQEYIKNKSTSEIIEIASIRLDMVMISLKPYQELLKNQRHIDKNSSEYDDLIFLTHHMQAKMAEIEAILLMHQGGGRKEAEKETAKKEGKKGEAEKGTVPDSP